MLCNQVMSFSPCFKIIYSKLSPNCHYLTIPKTYKVQFSKPISTSCIAYGKRNFRKFHFPNKRGNITDRIWLGRHPEEYDHQGMRLAGYWEDGKFIHVPEMVPELIVPNLKDFNLKPYVSYRTPDVVQEKFTPEHLFAAVYSRKIKADFNEGKLDENGNPLEPSEEEKLNPDEAWSRGRSSGSDLFG